MTKEEYTKRFTQLLNKIKGLEKQMEELLNQYNSELPFQPGEYVMIQERDGSGAQKYLLEGFLRCEFDAFVVRKVYPNGELEYFSITVYGSDRISKI